MPDDQYLGFSWEIKLGEQSIVVLNTYPWPSAVVSSINVDRRDDSTYTITEDGSETSDNAI